MSALRQNGEPEICPRCNKRPRSPSRGARVVQSYCFECRQEYNRELTHAKAAKAKEKIARGEVIPVETKTKDYARARTRAEIQEAVDRWSAHQLNSLYLPERLEAKGYTVHRRRYPTEKRYGNRELKGLPIIPKTKFYYAFGKNYVGWEVC